MMTWRTDSSDGYHRGRSPIRRRVWPPVASGNNSLGTEVNGAHQRRRKGRGLSERILVQKSEDGMTGPGEHRGSLALVLEPREAIVRASESSDTRAGLQKTGGMDRETVKTVLQHAVFTIGHGLFGRDPLRSHWSAFVGVIVIVIVIMIVRSFSKVGLAI